MAESLRTRLERFGFNFFPAYRGTGGRIRHIAADWSEVRVALPLNWRTRNYVGSIFGGSMYGALDPIYMVMLIKRLGPDFEVWDKAASIRFRRPGRTTLHATFRVDDALLAEVRDAVARDGRVERTFTVDLVDAAGLVHASCDKLLTIRGRERRTVAA
ncbi:MAG: DUF4442 domain-containing protein [Vicinamibacteria bacterium]|jgi:acyl-coenzyme A thioesterase PaaI-like protein|nr:DUF4442 domain-containing protein [Vicinamibacteria bacterium]